MQTDEWVAALTRYELPDALRAKLLVGISDVPAERNDEQHARWLLSYLLDWHRREDKAGWWEYFRLLDLPEEDLYDEPQAIAGLEYVERVGVVVAIVVIPIHGPGVQILPISPLLQLGAARSTSAADVAIGCPGLMR